MAYEGETELFLEAAGNIYLATLVTWPYSSMDLRLFVPGRCREPFDASRDKKRGTGQISRLAEDAGKRLDHILDTILATLAHRRTTSGDSASGVESP